MGAVVREWKRHLDPSAITEIERLGPSDCRGRGRVGWEDLGDPLKRRIAAEVEDPTAGKRQHRAGTAECEQIGKAGQIVTVAPA
jgi:hypothetical protein